MFCLQRLTARTAHKPVPQMCSTLPIPPLPGRRPNNKNQRKRNFRWSLSKFVYPMYLAGFRRLRLRHKLLWGTKPLLRFWFRKCLKADKLSGVLDTVGHFVGCQPWGFTSSPRNSAVLVTTFCASFRCFG